MSAHADGDSPGVCFRDCDTAPEMIVVPTGEFIMGSPDHEGDDDARPQHKVTIAKPFAVSIAPVMRGEFAAFIRATNREIEAGAWVWNLAACRGDPADATTRFKRARPLLEQQSTEPPLGQPASPG